MKNSSLRYSSSFVVAVGALVILAFASCSYNPEPAGQLFCDLLADGEPSAPTSSERHVVFEEPGIIIVHHGFTCAESDQPNEEIILKVDETVDLPAYVTKATVFLNGWRCGYLFKDHNVAGLGTAIGNIRFERQALKWQAAGMISDNNFDNAYRWCYWYTVVAWNDAVLPLTVDQDDGCKDDAPPSESNLFAADNTNTTTALSCFPSFLMNPGFAAGSTVAVLPRGFGFVWESISENTPDDHHLLQIAYNLDHAEVFAEHGKRYRKEDDVEVLSLPNSASQAGPGIASWETYTIFKDNKERRDYGFGEVVSGLAGTDVGVIQPPFCILPVDDPGTFTGCITNPGALRSDEFVIEKIPFQFAIPMLTGWDLAYECDDENVKEVGAALDTWTYDRATGTLRYTLASVLRDKGGDPAHRIRHKVTILGLRPTTTQVTPIKRPADLVPFSPAGNSPAAFCRLAAGPALVVTVKNQGAGGAAASKTTVDFAGLTVTQNTPAIAPGESVDLLVKIPGDCLDSTCTFTIQVDAADEVQEGDREDNNKAAGECNG